MAQEFVLPQDLSWAPVGHNMSLVVFRGEDDFVLLSYTLRDANGAVLLAGDGLELGDRPANLSATGDLPQGHLAGTLPVHSTGRRLLFGRVGRADRDGVVQPSDAEQIMTMEDAMLDDVRHQPGSRALLKGGGTRTASSAGGARSGAALAGPHVAHGSIARPWGGGRPSTTSYGMTSRHAVLAGTVVLMMHHGGSGGFGRYYDSPHCTTYHGCDVNIAEPLARDALRGSFRVSADLAFPLVLRITVCNVTRTVTRDGPPTLFLTLYSPTGGAPERTWIDSLLALYFIPLILCCFCVTRLITACDAPPQDHQLTA